MSRRLALPALLVSFFCAGAPAEVSVYTDEAVFLGDLSALGYSAVHEGFENDSAWGAVRSTLVGGNQSLPSVSHLGLVWTSNNSNSQVTTGEGAAWTGGWGFYSLPHGSYTNPEPGSDCTNPGACGDGFRVAAATGTLYAIGGWFHTNTPMAKLGVFLGPYPDHPVDLGETCDPDGENCEDNALLGPGWKFLGILDPTGFENIEFRELEGTLEDAKLIFADDFFFADSTVRGSIWSVH